MNNHDPVALGLSITALVVSLTTAAFTLKRYLVARNWRRKFDLNVQYGKTGDDKP